MSTNINQDENGRASGRDYIENQSNKHYNFTINKNSIIVLLIIFLLISLFFNYELNKDKNSLMDNISSLEKENGILEYKVNIIPLMIKKEQNMNTKFDVEKVKKEIDDIVD